MALPGRRRWTVGGLVVVLLAGGGTAYAVAGGDSTPRYRTVAATTGDVEETLASSGTVDAARRADLGFGTAGTIARLEVALGDTVRAGQVLAVLDTTGLDASVTQAEAAVAKAVAQLASDRSAQSSAVKNAVSSKPTSPAGSASTPSKGDNGATAATLKALQELQDAVIAAQSDASAALAAAKTALAAQTSACADAYQAPSAGSTDAPAATDDAGAACTAALAEVQARQQDVSDAQGVLARALDELASALGKALGSVSANPGTGSQSRTSSSTRTSSSARTTPTTSGSSAQQSASPTITAAQLATDQAQIEQARADLVTSQQARSHARLRSTRSGRVAALDAAHGDAVTAGQTVATVIGGKAVTVVGSVSEEKVGLVKVGQRVRVTVPGNARAADGRVTAISMVADTASGTTSYPVTVTVDDPSIALPTGSQALLAIVLSTVKDVVTVPTSAVTRRTSSASVSIWNGSRLTTAQVKIGAVSARTVQITSGLQAGDRVVLAAIDDPIKGANSTLNGRGGFGGNAPTLEFRQGGPGAKTASSAG